jgi:hypothetical protein
MKRHCRTLLFSVWLAGIFAFLPTMPYAKFRAANYHSEEINFSLEGKITRREAGKLTVNTAENILFHVRYDEKTEIRASDGSPASALDLRVGVRIAVEGTLEESGEISARRIEIRSPK